MWHNKLPENSVDLIMAKDNLSANKPLMLDIRFLIFLAGVVISRAGWFMVLPFLAVYLHKVFHCGPVEIGLILGIGPLASCLVGIFGGILADKYGSKRTMLWSLLMSASLFFLFTLLHTPFAFAILNLGLGIFRAFYDTASKSYLVELVPLADRVHAFGLRYSAINVGGVVGPPLAAMLFTVSPQWIFVIAGVSYIATFFAYLMSLQAFQGSSIALNYWGNLKNSLQTLAKDKAILILVLIGVLVYLTESQIDSTIPQVMATRIKHYLHLYSWLLVTNALTVIIFQIPLNYLMQRYPLKWFVYTAVLFYAISFVGLAFADNSYWFVIAVFVFSLGEVANASANSVLIDKLSPSHMKGAYFGAANLSFLGLSLGPFLGGIVLSYSNGFFLYLIMSLLVACCFFLYGWCYRYSQRIGIQW